MKDLSFVIIQHSVLTPPGSTLEYCQQNNIPYQVFAATACDYSQITLDPNKTVIVICGGSMNVDQEDQFPWLRKEKEFLRKAIGLKVKCVGLCLGAQMLAELSGAKVQKHDHWEVGWHEVSVQQNPLGPEENIMVFQYHGYRFEFDSLAWVFAKSAAWNQQAFLISDHILGFQYHPEAKTEWIEYCCGVDDNIYSKQDKNFHELSPTGQFVQDSSVTLSLAPRLQPILQDWYHKYLDQFLKYSAN